jgi:beta-lactamase superfamily II metal-dependent hydrolase
LITDDELENKAAMKKVINRYEIKRIVMSAYYSSTNEMIERKHRSIANSFAQIRKKAKEKSKICM